LKLIAEHGGIANTKAALQDKGNALEDFRRSLRDLAKLGINPVTIPNEWGITHLPNLLDTYYDQLTNKAAPLTLEEKRVVSKYALKKQIETETLSEIYSTSKIKKRKKH
jgi:hypothetical protein